MMSFKSKKRALPGTLIYTGETNKETTIKHIKYNKDQFETYNERKDLSDNEVDWIVIEGLNNVPFIQELGIDYNIDYLTIEDILNVNQRTKVEVHENYIFSVIKYALFHEDKIKYDYISILLFKDKVITFSELENRFIEDIISRIKNPNSPIRQKKHDYLYYVILDMLIDESIEVTNYLELQLEDIEEDLLALTSHHQVVLYNIRKELLFLRNMTSQLLSHNPKEIFKNETFFEKGTFKYYEDVIDHILNMNNRVVSQIDNTKHILDVYMNHMSNKMNSIMTTLTIFSAIFIPLSFIAGVFGMNFINFPILQNDHGMLYFILISVLIPTVMLVFFKLKKWL
jgi:magnesium transporter